MPRLLVLAVFISTALAVAGPAVADAPCGPEGCRADISISGHTEPSPIRLGDTSEFKLTGENNGPQTAKNVVLRTTVPEGLTITSIKSYATDPCSVDGRAVTCPLGDMVAEQITVVLINVRGTQVAKHIVPATVSSDGPSDPTGGNNHASTMRQ